VWSAAAAASSSSKQQQAASSSKRRRLQWQRGGSSGGGSSKHWKLRQRHPDKKGQRRRHRTEIRFDLMIDDKLLVSFRRLRMWCCCVMKFSERERIY
jgi:hypothetical protein